MVSTGPDHFRLGVNYWPAEVGMEWLRAYDPIATRRDFALMASAGLDTARVFVRWDDIQPSPDRIEAVTLAHLVDSADAAQAAGVELIVTLFVGHMSGVNWIPRWATGGAGGDRRFPIVSGSVRQPAGTGLRNWYVDPGVVDAQARLATAIASALAGHPAVWAWDLGNENSNCSVPPDRAAGERWLERMTGALRGCDPGRPVTIGIHMEDLEEDRGIGPAQAAQWCDFVCMHGYPIYASWSSGPVDDRLVPFLTLITRWLSGGAPVLFEEFGLPTIGSTGRGSPMEVDESAAAEYCGRVIDGLWEVGATGALWWCFADYCAALFGRPPFDEALHERTFGLWRADHSPKPALVEITQRRGRVCRPVPAEAAWIDISPEEFSGDRRRQLARLYSRYQKSIEA